MQRAYGFSLDVTNGVLSPAATVTVYNTGTLTLSTIYSDTISTPKANPFTSDATTSYWFFYAADGVYDVKISGTSITTYTEAGIGLGAAGGSFSLNSQTGSTQTLGTATTGTDFTITSAANAHTFAIPSASATARGLVTTGTQTIAGAKTFTTPIAAGSGGTGVDGSAAANGRLIIGNGAGFTLAPLTGTANQVIVTPGAGSITLSLPQDINTSAIPEFDTILCTGLTPNTAAVLDVNYGIQPAAGGDGQIFLGRGTSNQPPAFGDLVSSDTSINISRSATQIDIGIAAAGASILSLNGLTGASWPNQTFSAATTGTDFSISSASGGHTFALPSASASARGVVTTGTQTFAGAKNFEVVPTFEVSASVSDSCYVSGVRYTAYTPVGNVGAGEDTLQSLLVTGGSFATAGRAIRVTAWGSTANNGASKTVKMYIDSVVMSKALTVSIAGSWRIVAEAVVIDSGNMSVVASLVQGATALTECTVTPIAITLGSDFTIKCTGEATSNNDIIQAGTIVEILG